MYTYLNCTIETTFKKNFVFQVACAISYFATKTYTSRERESEKAVHFLCI